ncbi:hypothetical protein GCM10027429_32830 [Marivirga atlantica]|jgi:hypothetical protein|uniref:PH domain-containing protein n=1 Tax=Marivirga atlantica TaxID=1548457 RepID=A0A937ADL3_9BACT|nr:hypothetical protein [Marivirga atlantica]MBL0766860.1 hypothetical protein [Marivirga atlantica]
MIKSGPKYQTVFALSVFLILLFISFFFLLNSLLSNPEFFILKLILTPIVLVIALLILNKLIAGVKTIEAGNNQISVFHPISRKRIKLQIADILGWQEEVVKTKNGDFRETKILYAKKKVIKLSNKENTEYDRLVKYLRQKAKKKEVRNK